MEPSCPSYDGSGHNANNPSWGYVAVARLLGLLRSNSGDKEAAVCSIHLVDCLQDGWQRLQAPASARGLVPEQQRLRCACGEALPQLLEAGPCDEACAGRQEPRQAGGHTAAHPGRVCTALPDSAHSRTLAGSDPAALCPAMHAPVLVCLCLQGANRPSARNITLSLLHQPYFKAISQTNGNLVAAAVGQLVCE